MSKAKTTEVIELDSEDEATTSKVNVEKKKPTPTNAKCINFKCTSTVNKKTAPSFACAYYGVNTVKKKKRFICQKCLEAAIEHQELLADALYRKEPLLNCEFPDHTMEVEISDSDDSDQFVETKSDGN